MKIDINSFYEPILKKCKNYNVEIIRGVINNDAIASFLKNSVVKYIFLNNEYKNLSSEPSVSEIHKFKAKYRGNTYIRIPLVAVQHEDDKYIRGFREIQDIGLADGFAVVSKHDLREQYKHLKYANREKRVDFGTELCKEHLEEYNNVLSGEVFKLVIKEDKNNTIVYDKIVIGIDNVTDIISKVTFEENIDVIK